MKSKSVLTILGFALITIQASAQQVALPYEIPSPSTFTVTPLGNDGKGHSRDCVAAGGLAIGPSSRSISMPPLVPNVTGAKNLVFNNSPSGACIIPTAINGTGITSGSLSNYNADTAQVTYITSEGTPYVYNVDLSSIGGVVTQYGVDYEFSGSCTQSVDATQLLCWYDPVPGNRSNRK